MKRARTVSKVEGPGCVVCSGAGIQCCMRTALFSMGPARVHEEYVGWWQCEVESSWAVGGSCSYNVRWSRCSRRYAGGRYCIHCAA